MELIRKQNKSESNMKNNPVLLKYKYFIKFFQLIWGNFWFVRY